MAEVEDVVRLEPPSPLSANCRMQCGRDDHVAEGTAPFRVSHAKRHHPSEHVAQPRIARRCVGQAAILSYSDTRVAESRSAPPASSLPSTAAKSVASARCASAPALRRAAARSLSSFASVMAVEAPAVPCSAAGARQVRSSASGERRFAARRQAASDPRSWGEANALAADVANPLADRFSPEDIAPVFGKAHNGADLIGSHGFREFTRLLYDKNPIPDPALEALLNEYNLGHYKRAEQVAEA